MVTRPGASPSSMAAWGQVVVPRASEWKAGLPLTDQRPGPQLAEIGVAPVGAAVGAAGDPSGMGFPGSEQSRQAAQPVLGERWDPLVEVARPLHQSPRGCVDWGQQAFASSLDQACSPQVPQTFLFLVTTEGGRDHSLLDGRTRWRLRARRTRLGGLGWTGAASAPDRSPTAVPPGLDPVLSTLVGEGCVPAVSIGSLPSCGALGWEGPWTVLWDPSGGVTTTDMPNDLSSATRSWSVRSPGLV